MSHYRAFIRPVNALALLFCICLNNNWKAKLAHADWYVVAQAKNSNHIIATLVIKKTTTCPTVVSSIEV